MGQSNHQTGEAPRGRKTGTLRVGTEMGICWSDPEPPVKRAGTVIPTAPVAQPYLPPQQYQYNPNYTYAVKQDQPTYSTYPQYQQPYQQQYQQQYQQSYPQTYVQAYPQQAYPQQRQTVGPGTAFVGGLVMGAMIEDILDPTE
jgi:hypothetical protein